MSVTQELRGFLREVRRSNFAVGSGLAKVVALAVLQTLERPDLSARKRVQEQYFVRQALRQVMYEFGQGLDLQDLAVAELGHQACLLARGRSSRPNERSLLACLAQLEPKTHVNTRAKARQRLRALRQELRALQLAEGVQTASTSSYLQDLFVPLARLVSYVLYASKNVPDDEFIERARRGDRAGQGLRDFLEYQEPHLAKDTGPLAGERIRETLGVHTVHCLLDDYWEKVWRNNKLREAVDRLGENITDARLEEEDEIPPEGRGWIDYFEFHELGRYPHALPDDRKSGGELFLYRLYALVTVMATANISRHWLDDSHFSSGLAWEYVWEYFRFRHAVEDASLLSFLSNTCSLHMSRVLRAYTDRIGDPSGVVDTLHNLPELGRVCHSCFRSKKVLQQLQELEYPPEITGLIAKWLDPVKNVHQS